MGAISRLLNESRLPAARNFELKSAVRWVLRNRPSARQDMTEEGLLLRHIIEGANADDWIEVEQEIRILVASLPLNELSGEISIEEIDAFNQELADRCRSKLVRDTIYPRHPDHLQLAEVALVSVQLGEKSHLRSLLNYVFNNWFNR